MESIYVTPDGKWKLGRLDCTRKLAMNTIEHLKLVNVLCDSDIYPAKPKVTYSAVSITNWTCLYPCVVLYGDMRLKLSVKCLFVV